MARVGPQRHRKKKNRNATAVYVPYTAVALCTLMNCRDLAAIFFTSELKPPPFMTQKSTRCPT